MAPEDDKTRTFVPLTTGTMVSHYRIIEKIGAGGMGEVYLAEDTELNRKVALKFLPSHLCQDPECRARFKREAQAAAKLNHPNIITIYEVSEFNNRPFFAMELIEGESLTDFIKKRDHPIEKIIDLSIQICEGLNKAHQAGIIHRDIKPSNILLDHDGRAKILDFGLAAIKGDKKLTKTGSTLGTISYMSPEQTRGEELDNRSDIFSFGIVLYEMITGHLPFKGDHEPAIIHSISFEEPEPLARYKSGVSEELQRIVSKAMAKDKNQRYQHADELAADLRGLISATARVPISKRFKKSIVIMSLVLLGILVIIVFLKPWRVVAPPSDKEAGSRKRVVIVPFRNQTGDSTLDVLGRMIADWTTQGLLESGLAEVVPPEKLSEFDKGTTIRSVVKTTGAGAIVIGSYYKFGDTIQYQAQIVDANEVLLQAIDPIKSQASKVMDGVESVRQHVLGALAFALDKRLQKPIMQVSRPPKYDAYQEYIQGFDLFTLKEDYAAALAHFNQAFALDTSFILSLFMACCANLNMTKWPQADSLAKLLDSHRARLNRTQQLDLDYLGGIISGDWLKALNAAREEIKFAPESKNYYMDWAQAAFHLNRPRECIEALSIVDTKDTMVRRSNMYWDLLGVAHHCLGQYETELEMAEECKKEIPASYITLKCQIRALAGLGKIAEIKKLVEEGFTYPNQPGIPEVPVLTAALELRTHGYEAEAMKILDQLIQWYQGKSDDEKQSNLWLYGFALYQARRWLEAGEIFKELVKLRPDIVEFQYYLGRTAARLGNRKEAMKISDSLNNLQQPYLFGGHTYCRASIAAILGEKEQAISLLKESFRQGHDYQLHIDFDFELLKDYLPFVELMKPKG
jgi:serine/threonine protein kinase